MSQQNIKCVVWDLDNTIWKGTLLESDEIALNNEMVDVIRELDRRGILNSISSKNDYNDAMKKLDEFGIKDYFLYPQINWNAKSSSIEKISKLINISKDTIMFIDDQPFELEEVSSVYSEVMCINVAEVDKILSNKRLIPRFSTDELKNRRLIYMQDIERKKDEEEFIGPQEVFLSSLNMKLIISEAEKNDLFRAEELTVRTNQLNATGITYSYDELDKFRCSDKHKLLVYELEDKYGSYGKIGIALIELKDDYWHLKLLLMSCRTMSRGIGTVAMSYIMNEAKKANKKLRADFIKTDRNKVMYVSYKFSNFKEIYSNENGEIIFENDLSIIQKYPPYIDLCVK